MQSFTTNQGFAQSSNIYVPAADRVRGHRGTKRSVFGWLNYHLWTRCTEQRTKRTIACLITHVQTATCWSSGCLLGYYIADQGHVYVVGMDGDRHSKAT